MSWRLIFILFIVTGTILTTVKVDRSLPEENKQITVEIRGHVRNPGVYELPIGSTYNDLLSKAVPDEDAMTDDISLQAVLYNKQLIIIPEKSSNKLISINSAGIDELISLPGIGKSTAQKIIDYRDQNGSFLSLEDLMNVKGIGYAKFSRIKEYISL